MRIHIIIPIEPDAQTRPRTATLNGHAMAYKSKKQRTREDNLRELLYQHPDRPAIPLDTPLKLGVRIVRSIPKSWSKRDKAAALAGELRPVSKPDLDNYLKHLKDVCNGVIWADDKQVVEYLPGTGKWYGELACWEITIEAA